MSFIETQQAFMAHIRDPENQPAPTGIEPRRLKIYQELFFNNIEGFVSSAFPVLKSVYSDAAWQRLIRQFFVVHDCQSPHFLDISKEFLLYLQTEYQPQPEDPCFLLELAHYEWLELDVATTKESPDEQVLEANNLSSAALQLASTVRLGHYQYPVHQITADYQPQSCSAETYSFALYRDAEDEVQFIALNPMTALLLSLIDSNPGITLAELVADIQAQAPQFSVEQLQQGAEQTLTEFASRGILVAKVL